MTGKPKPLSEKQRDVLRRADGTGKVGLAGRGCKQILNGLAGRGLVERVRIDLTWNYGGGYLATLTEAGRKLAVELKTEERLAVCRGCSRPVGKVHSPFCQGVGLIGQEDVDRG